MDQAAEIAENQKKRVDPSFHGKIDALLDTYSKKLAANMNNGFAIDSRVPSVLIAGGPNFPTRKNKTPPVIKIMENGKIFKDFLKKSEAPEWAESMQTIRTL